jgi:hypothetical protein
VLIVIVCISKEIIRDILITTGKLWVLFTFPVTREVQPVVFVSPFYVLYVGLHISGSIRYLVNYVTICITLAVRHLLHTVELCAPSHLTSWEVYGEKVALKQVSF